MQNNRDFYLELEKEIQNILDFPVPEILIKESRDINNKLLELRYSISSEELITIAQKIINNILIAKGYKIINIDKMTFEVLHTKNNTKSIFDIFIINNENSDHLDLSKIPDENLEKILNSKANFIGLFFIDKKKVEFISNQKLKTLIEGDIIKNNKSIPISGNFRTVQI